MNVYACTALTTGSSVQSPISQFVQWTISWLSSTSGETADTENGMPMTESVSVHAVCRRGVTLRALKKNCVSVFASLLRWYAFVTVPSGTVAMSVVTSTRDTQLMSQMHSTVFRQLLGSTATDSVLETISSDAQTKSEGSEKRSRSCTIGAEL